MGAEGCHTEEYGVIMPMKHINVTVSSVAIAAYLITTAVADTLEIGNQAPALEVHEWVKGTPIDLAAVKGKQITVVEFWATWCGPCVHAIPHMTELAHNFADKNVRIVGVTTYDEGNTLETVREFVKKQGDKMDYAVAFDKTEDLYNSYMTAAAQDGIPTAFVVDLLGRIAWIGHPMDGLDAALTEIIAGTYDIELAGKLGKIDRQIQDAWMIGEWETVLEHADEAIALKPGDPDRWMTKFHVYSDGLADHEKAKHSASKALELAANRPEQLADIATSLITDPELTGYKDMVHKALHRALRKAPQNIDLRMASFQALAADNKNKKALTLAAETIDLMKGDADRLARFAHVLSSPERRDLCSDLAIKAVDLAIQAQPQEPSHHHAKFRILNECKNDVPAATVTGRYLIELAADDAGMLNGFAWGLLTDQASQGKYSELALAAAEALHKASGGDGWSQLDTIALAKFENGLVKEAVALQKEAIAKCSNENARASLEDTLKRFTDKEKEVARRP